jgi:DNA-binding transcriptional MerR regulator
LIRNLGWSEEEIQILLDLARKGCSFKEIAEVLPYRTTSSIKKKLYAFGFTMKDIVSRRIDYNKLEEVSSSVNAVKEGGKKQTKTIEQERDALTMNEKIPDSPNDLDPFSIEIFEV